MFLAESKYLSYDWIGGILPGFVFSVSLQCPQFLEEISHRKVFKFGPKNPKILYKEVHTRNS